MLLLFTHKSILLFICILLEVFKFETFFKNLHVDLFNITTVHGDHVHIDLLYNL